MMADLVLLAVEAVIILLVLATMDGLIQASRWLYAQWRAWRQTPVLVAADILAPAEPVDAMVIRHLRMSCEACRCEMNSRALEVCRRCGSLLCPSCREHEHTLAACNAAQPTSEAING